MPEAMPGKTVGRPQTASKEEEGMGDLPQRPVPCPLPAHFPHWCPLSSSPWRQFPSFGPPRDAGPGWGALLDSRDSLVPPHLCLGRGKGDCGGYHDGSYSKAAPPPGPLSSKSSPEIPNRRGSRKTQPAGPMVLSSESAPPALWTQAFRERLAGEQPEKRGGTASPSRWVPQLHPLLSSGPHPGQTGYRRVQLQDPRGGARA